MVQDIRFIGMPDVRLLIAFPGSVENVVSCEGLTIIMEDMN